MLYKIFTTTTAKEEAEDAVLYYESVSEGLGLDFLNEIENRYNLISKNPFAYSFTDSRNIIRDVLVRRFPFVIIYKVESDKVIILSVHHTHKAPKH